MSTDSAPRPLRLWPGLAAAVLILLARFGVKAVIPGFEGYKLAMLSSMALSAVFVLWWLFLSRAPWLERLAGLALMAGGLFAAWQLRHESMSVGWLLGYALPLLCVAFAVATVLSRRLDDGPRRAVLAATILLACGAWTLVRTTGIDGDHDADYRWRFSPSAEEQLLAEKTGSADAFASFAPRPDEPAVPAWPGFRGTRRDGVVRGLRLATDWNATPPEELWRRPIGPGWSSFAVQGELIYTQEQRGEEELVSAYRLATGEPVWQHRDTARFFESNAGAGPRATPALAGGRVFAVGATGLINALDALSGRQIWSRNIADDTGAALPDWGFSGSPVATDQQVIAAAGGRLVAYDAATGEIRWTGPEAGGGYSSPHLVRIDGDPQIVLLSGVGATAVSPTDGSQLWRHEWGGFPMIQPAVISQGELLISAHDSSGMRRLGLSRTADGWQVEERWTSLGLKPYFNGFVVHEGHAYGFDARILSAIELESGERVWKGGRYGNGQMLLVAESDVLLVLSEKGELALVAADPGGFEELARMPALDGKTWNHPVLVGDVLLVRNGVEMAAFRLPTVSS